MKKVWAGYLGIMLLLFLLLGVSGSRMIRSVYESQMDMVSNLAGALFVESSIEGIAEGEPDVGGMDTDGINREDIEKYSADGDGASISGTYANAAGQTKPGADIGRFIDGLRTVTNKRTNAGRKLLAGYGYSEQWTFTIQGSYTRTLRQLWLLLGLFFFLLSGVGILYFYQIERHKKIQMARLRNLLEACHRDDYSFAEEEKALSDLYAPQFADSVVKLGQNLVLKTKQLEEEKNQTKTWVTDISHQLKTPLSALKSCFAMSMETEGEEQVNFLKACTRQIDRLERLMEALIQVARMEQGMIRVQPVESSLTEILVGAVNIVYHKAKDKEIEFDTEDVEGQEYIVTADPKWSAEAIANLLDNAVKYSPKGSRIQIRVQKLYSFIEIEIEDEGIGIPKEEQTLIYGRFYRGKSSSVKKEEGWGVGLYLSRKILEEEGGSLFMRQGRGCGSIFIVHLPYPQN